MTLASRRFSALTLLAALAAGALVAAAQSQTPQTPPVFRAEANLVEVIVRVTDADGVFVPGLMLEDFELREEGRAQSIVAFNEIDLPKPATATTGRAPGPPLAEPIASTVATNARAGEARTFVLLLDDVLTSPAFTIPARRAAREFVEQHIGPNDLVAAFSTGGRGVQTQEFTTDKTRVLQAIDRFIGRRCRSGPPFGSETHAEQVYNVRVSTDVIEALAAHLTTVRGRRVSLLWISEGVDYDVDTPAIMASDPGRDPTSAILAMQQAIDALRRANVTLYAIDPRLLYPPETDPPDNPGCRSPNRHELARSLVTLQNISEQSGGFAAINTNDFSPSFERIVDEASQYYVLGYQPSIGGRDGEFKRIDVRLRPPELQRLRISARSGRVVSERKDAPPLPSELPPALAAAMTQSVPTAGLTLRAQAIPRPGSKPDRGLVHVIVELPGDKLQYADIDGRATEQLSFAVRAIGPLGRIAEDRNTRMTLRLTPQERERIGLAGIRWITALDLPEGQHSLRIVTHAATTNLTGSVFLDVDVPAFSRDRLWIDGLAVTSLPAALTLTSGSSPMALGLPGPPTTARTFVKGDVITLGAEIGVRRDFTSGAVELTVHVQTAPQEAPPVLTRTIELADRATAEQPRAFAIDTAALGAGQFILRLAVRDHENRRAETAVLFEVIEQ